MNETTDSALLLSFVRGGGDADFATLVNRHRDMVYHTAYKVLQDWALSEDVVQATFETLAAKASDTVWQVGSLGGWLHRVAIDCARDLRKAEARRRAREQEAATLRSCEREADTDTIFLHEAIVRLPELYRQPLMLQYFEGYRQAEAASMLGISRTAFAVRCTRARETLRAWLQQRYLTRSCA